MIPDPTDVIRDIRRNLAAQFGNDIHRIAEDTRRRQRESGRKSIALPAAAPQSQLDRNQAIPPSGGGTVTPSGESAPTAG